MGRPFVIYICDECWENGRVPQVLKDMINSYDDSDYEE